MSFVIHFVATFGITSKHRVLRATLPINNTFKSNQMREEQVKLMLVSSRTSQSLFYSQVKCWIFYEARPVFQKILL